MNIAIISSSKDKASVNIKENLINNLNFNKLEEQFDNNDIFQNKINDKNIKLYTINSELVHAEDIDKKIGADLFVFISKHSAKEERKSLTLHPLGNFGKNELGGKEKTLCIAPSIYLKNIFNELDKNSQDSGFEASLEATHHGPYLEKPVLFIEIGTTEKEWTDKNAGNIIAKTLVSTLKDSNIIINNNKLKINNNENKINNNKNDNYNLNKIENKNNGNELKNNEKNNNYESVFVIGGSHYNYVANKVMLKSNFAAGHTCAKYNLENLDLDLIKQAMEKTIPKAKLVVLDWKGLGKEKQRILELLKKNNIEYERSDKFFD